MFVERNEVDGAEGRALRTCDGALAAEIDVTLTDRQDPARTHSFSWPCDESWASPELFFVAPPPVFLDLREGTYVVDTVARDEDDAFARELATIAVDGSTTTSLLVALGLPGTTLILELGEPAPCEQLALRLRYAQPQADVLGAPPRDPEDAYREALVSEEGIPLDGSPIACDALTERLTVRDVDRGRYVLERVIDGQVACRQPLDLRGEIERVPLELESDCPR